MPQSCQAPDRPHTRAPIGSAEMARSAAFGGMVALAGTAFQTRLRPHVHSSYVVGVVEHGAVEVTTQGETRVATAGSVLVIPPFVVHTELPAAIEGWSFRYLYIGADIVRDVLNVSRVRMPDTTSLLPSLVADDVALAHAIRRVDDAMRRPAAPSVVEGLVAGAIRLAGAHGATSPGREARARRNVLAVRSLLTQRPHERISLGRMADAAGLSPLHFLRVFHDAVGLTPYAYFQQVRVAYAHEMICAGMTPSAVAYRLGFADQSHLNRQFGRGSFTTPGRLARLVARPATGPRSRR